jgi:selenoprotein W-related protein
LAAEILKDLEAETKSITLFPSDGGRFEVEVNNFLVYSKQKTGRHAEPGEVLDLIKEHIKKR